MKTNDDKPLVPDHLSDDEILSYLDGEVGAELQTGTQAHLEGCWDCRARLSSFERSIENFLQVRQRMMPTDLPPSGPALKLFRERLHHHQSLSPTHSFLRDRINGLRLSSRRLIKAFDLSSYPLRTQVSATRGFAAAIFATILVGLLLFSFRAPTVSASELLRLSIEAQGAQIQRESDPVLHQKVKVSRSGANSIGTQGVTWEVWNDTTNSRVRSITDSGVQTAQKASVARLIIDDLRSILRASGMDDQHPISASSYRSWSDSLAEKTETVSKEIDESGSETLTITTVPGGSGSDAKIGEARIVFRAADYHPIKLHIKLGSQSGYGQIFEITEDHFEVVSLKSLDPSIFSDPGKVETAANNLPGTRMETNANTNTLDPTTSKSNANHESGEPGPQATTAEAEVEVLDLLNKVGADISEQLSVTRTADGYLTVEGLVETSERKGEILKALSPVAGDRRVRIKIQTIEEATLALQKRTEQSRPETVERVEIEKGGAAIDPELREYFARQGGDIDAQIRAFSSRVVNRSRSAVFQASALNRMSNRFTPSQIEALTPEARTKWLNILRGYAAAVRQESVALRVELEAAIGGFPEGRGESISSDADLITSAKQLYELASQTDRAVRSAFTYSNSGGSAAAVKNQQFRRNLARLESLAAAIERAR
jgi:hypothetical protein